MCAIRGILDNINYPSDLRKLDIGDLSQLCDELRDDVISMVSRVGGHLGAGLGVIELTVALHYVFETPEDKLIWDVGHQTYPHKILTGRRKRMDTLRQYSGISGFTKIDESIYDVFGAGHSSTSISAALGIASARDHLSEDYEVVSIIGDGAMSAGMAYEAMNNAGAINTKLIVVLNDNKMSISPAVGALSKYLSKLISSEGYTSLRKFISDKIIDYFPSFLKRTASNTEKFVRTLGGNIFEDLGFYYVGPVDGHDVVSLVKMLKNIRDNKEKKPFLLHVLTEKGRGFKSDKISNIESYHAVKKFDRETLKEVITKDDGKISYSNLYGETLLSIAKKDKKVVAISAAMVSGTGLNKFATILPDQLYDVGIAEQHAVTFSAGLALQGLKPFCTIYSTFLQRAYDQIIHDVAIQKLPVRFMIDRAGLVGADGPTHAGVFDIVYLSIIPNIIVMVPSNNKELEKMIHLAYELSNVPSAIRYPRGKGETVDYFDQDDALILGKGRIIGEYLSKSEVIIYSIGMRVTEILNAKDILEKENILMNIVDARFVKPLDDELIFSTAKDHKIIITIEEGVSGGFGSMVMSLLTHHDLLQGKKFRMLTIPDEFIPHGDVDVLYDKCGLTCTHIVKLIKDVLENI